MELPEEADILCGECKQKLKDKGKDMLVGETCNICFPRVLELIAGG